jgi:hypothetical protein
MRSVLIHEEIFIATPDAAQTLGIKSVTLRNWAARDKQANVIITLHNGLRFIRRPRYEGDPHPPLFWCVAGVIVPKPVHGFAAMSKEQVSAAQGKALETRRREKYRLVYKSDASREASREGGRKGGLKVSQDREHMREIGRIGRTRGPRNRREKHSE